MKKDIIAKTTIAGKDINQELLNSIAIKFGYPDKVQNLKLVDPEGGKFKVLQPKKDGDFILVRVFS